jgi:hypothetical protein
MWMEGTSDQLQFFKFRIHSLFYTNFQSPNIHRKLQLKSMFKLANPHANVHTFGYWLKYDWPLVYTNMWMHHTQHPKQSTLTTPPTIALSIQYSHAGDASNFTVNSHNIHSVTVISPLHFSFTYTKGFELNFLNVNCLGIVNFHFPPLLV